MDEIAEHASIVARRAGELAYAETWRSLAGRGVVCVVADDRPGLLALISSALSENGLNIASAQVYCRSLGDGSAEAVDFFALEPSEGEDGAREIEPSELAGFVQTLKDLIAEDQSVARLQREQDTIPVPAPKPSRVYFDIESLSRGDCVLIVETPDFPGLLSAITSALHGEGMRILWSEVRTEHGIARDRFGLTGGARQTLNSERLCDVQQAVQEALRAQTMGF